MKAQERFGRLFKSEAAAGSQMLPGGGSRRITTSGDEKKSSISKISSGLDALDTGGGRVRGAGVPVGMK